jgi:hypothetical protein
MSVLYPSFFVVFGFSASAVILGWAYFRRFEISRPPIGVLGLGDVGVMIGAIVVLPYLYLGLPLWLVAAIFASGVLSIHYFTVGPILRARWATWLITLMLLGIDIWSQFQFGATSTPYHLVNNTVLVLSIVGATNLWAQSGMKARDVAVLAGVLALYDLIATSVLPLTTDLLLRLTSIPLTPLVTWGAGNEGLGVGLGDLLLATVFPLVMRKAFGRAAGIVAIVTTLSVSAVMLALLMLANLTVTLPAMTALGPLMVLQYGYWIRRLGRERTTRQYLQAEPPNRRIIVSDR